MIVQQALRFNNIVWGFEFLVLINPFTRVGFVANDVPLGCADTGLICLPAASSPLMVLFQLVCRPPRSFSVDLKRKETRDVLT